MGSRVHRAASACVVGLGVFLCGLGGAMAIAEPSASTETAGRTHSTDVPGQGPKGDSDASGGSGASTGNSGKPDTGNTPAGIRPTATAATTKAMGTRNTVVAEARSQVRRALPHRRRRRPRRRRHRVQRRRHLGRQPVELRPVRRRPARPPRVRRRPARPPHRRRPLRPACPHPEVVVAGAPLRCRPAVRHSRQTCSCLPPNRP